MCIVFASVLGFFIGLARLSDTGCYESFPQFILRSSVIFPRAANLLLVLCRVAQFARTTTGVSAFDLAFLSNRGLYIPSPRWETDLLRLSWLLLWL